MNDNDFWNSIIATDEDKIKGAYYLRERGLEEHINVLNYLQSFTKNKNRQIEYSEIATVLRYDKRIRRCLFKYIGVVEERIRAHLLDFYRSNASSFETTQAFLNNMKKYSNDVYQSINHLMFKQLITIFKKQPDYFKTEVFPNLTNIVLNLSALVSLRNQVCHNKFLLNNREFEVCKYNGYESSSLSANIKNLYLLSDLDCREGLEKEINVCATAKTSKYNYQVKWKLPRDVIIKIDYSVSVLK